MIIYKIYPSQYILYHNNPIKTIIGKLLKLMMYILILLINLNLSSTKVTFDGRSFSINNSRELLFGGSLHYPRASAGEWLHLVNELKANGINLIQG